VDTKDGVSITENTDLDGFTSTIDTCDGQTVAGPGCTETYAPAWTSDSERAIGQASSVDYYGLIYTPTSNEDVCAIDLYIEGIDGTLSSAHDYYISIFTINGADCQALLGTSVKIDGDAMVADTWTSANAGLFTFATPVSLTASTSYIIGAWVDQDGNLTDNPEHDATNHPEFGDDNNNNGDAITGGRIYCSWDAAIPYVGTLSDANDDPLFRIHTQ
jgi:hypothetical protein